jgi:hypothetical protein
VNKSTGDVSPPYIKQGPSEYLPTLDERFSAVESGRHGNGKNGSIIRVILTNSMEQNPS